MQGPDTSCLDSLNDPVVITDEAYRCLYVNESFCNIFQGNPAHWQGQPFPDQTGLTKPGTSVFETKSGTALNPVWIEWRRTDTDDGRITLVGRDVSSRRKHAADLDKQINAAEDGNDSKMRFLATMSHEMRTPLNGILGMAGLLLDAGLDPNQKTYAEAVRESGTALLALINDILDYSKIEAGKIDLEETTFDPQTLVQGVTELLSPRAAHKGIEIASYIAPTVPYRMVADEGRLRQVLLNLAGNGVKFTDKGGVTIEVNTTEPVKGGMARIRIDVRDTGIGIPEHELPAIFDEFAQADSSSTRKNEGTGLGLAIAQRIIRAMGGDITVQSRHGKGSLFSFTVPVKAKIDGPRSKTIEPVSDTVIVLTQSAVLKRILPLQLRAAKVNKYYLVNSADEALLMMEGKESYTLLCDLTFAAQHGQKLVKAADHSLVLLSPVARGRLETFRRAGFGGYLIKPIRQTSLQERLIEKSAPELTTKRLDAPATAPQSGPRKYRVLLAEDNQINTVLASTIIKRAGHHVDIAGNGKEAVAAVQQAPYDVILMDMHMPEMDGMEASRRIRQLGDETAKLPIIALTANVQRSDRELCKAAGMDDFLTKPFNPEDLTSLIEKWAARNPAGSSLLTKAQK